MKDEDRLKIVKRIDKKLKESNSLYKAKNELEELKKDKNVLRYISLCNRIENFEQKLYGFKDKEDIISKEFSWAIDYAGMDIDECTHDIWVYNKSIKKSNEPNKMPLKECKNEDDEGFIYNNYTCLECGKKISVRDYKIFEENNIVLKDSNININYYRNLYYNYLYNYDSDTAKEYITKEFEKTKSMHKKH